MKMTVHQLIDQHYAQHAATLGLGEVKGGPWVRVDGTPYVPAWSLGQIEYVADRFSSKPEEFVDKIGVYCSNNGRLAYVGANGGIYVGRADSKNYKALHDAGHRAGGLFVPFSNGEHPLDSEVKDGFHLVRHGADSEESLGLINARQYAQSAADKKGITPLTADEEKRFIKLNGLVIENFGELNLFPSADRHNIQFDNVGRMATNNGVVAFVNEQNQTLVASGTSENIALLQKHGYKSEGSFFVPMSNGENIVGYMKPGSFAMNDKASKDQIIRDSHLEERANILLGRSPYREMSGPKTASAYDLVH